MHKLERLKLINRFHKLGPHFYETFAPQGLTEPTVVAANEEVGKLITLKPDDLQSALFLQVFTGNTILPGMQPLAHDYAGHQFGQFNPFLGDGRAVLLFDTETETGRWEVNLKGIGKTPYSRDFDGRASLSACLREHELSQQLTAQGIPTTQCLCVIAGKEQVYRGQFEPAAILTRIAPCFIRFGTFENYYFQRNAGALRTLTEYVIRHYYPQCLVEDRYDYALFLQLVVKNTARLIAHWQTAGFVHGMMNTDNQSILGISLDLGEAAFNESMDPGFVSSKHDEKGRYAFGQQPLIGLWNCNVLARALSLLITDTDIRNALTTYEPEYLYCYEELSAKN